MTSGRSHSYLCTTYAARHPYMLHPIPASPCLLDCSCVLCFRRLHQALHVNISLHTTLSHCIHTTDWNPVCFKSRSYSEDICLMPCLSLPVMVTYKPNSRNEAIRNQVSVPKSSPFPITLPFVVRRVRRGPSSV